MVFDYAFLGSAGEELTIPVLVARDRRTQMLFAHVVPARGLSHEHGAKELELDIQKLGYSEGLLKCDGEPALESVQEEVRRIRKEPTIIDNSGVGGSRSNGAAERAVQAIGEQVRVIRYGLESRLEGKLKGSHAVTCWLMEHYADVLNKHSVGPDGRPHTRGGRARRPSCRRPSSGRRSTTALTSRASRGTTSSRAAAERGYFLFFVAEQGRRSWGA